MAFDETVETDYVSVVVTKHAMRRMKERMGLPRSAVQRTADRAWEHGTHHADANNRLGRKWLDAVYFKERKANQMRIYGEFLYLFRNRKLLTVLLVPYCLRDNLRQP